jgi:DNA topoisomerase-3
MQLVIAEKPSVAQSIATVLGATTRNEGYFEGNGYTVTYAYGHLIEIVNLNLTNKWAEDGLPILEGLTLQPKASVGKQLSVIKTLFSKCDEIIVATDAGREGELIFRYIYTYLHCTKPFKRLWISSLTDSVIREGFAQLKSGTEYDSLYVAARARSEADWYVGINATRALTLAVKNGEAFSLGRVQTPTLAILCRRYLEHKNFVSEPFWTVDTRTQKAGVPFTIKISEKYRSKVAADTVVNTVKNLPTFQVTAVNTVPTRETPPLLYDLTNLQKDASKKFALTPDKTLEVAQSLYEKKFITYPRTGSRYIPEDVFQTLSVLITECMSLNLGLNLSYYSGNFTLNKKSVDGSKVTDHHALLPTDILPNLDTLSKSERDVYTLIVSRMYEAFHEDCIKDVTKVGITVGDYACEITGSVIRQAGWRGVQPTAVDDDDTEGGEKEKDIKLPSLQVGDILPNNGVEIKEDKTKPKPLLTDATLLSYMETAGKEVDNEQARNAMKDCGLGTPATRAAIIANLVEKHYIIRDKKKIIPTEKGLQTYEIVKSKSICSPDLTGQWEYQMTCIEAGTLPFETFMETVKTQVRTMVAELSEIQVSIKSDKQIKSELMPLCPKCKTQHLRLFEKGLGCVKECGFVVWRTVAEKTLKDTQLMDIAKKGKTGVIDGFMSKKTGKTFSATLKLDNEFKTIFDFDNQKNTKKN